jgi:hypothetical protein
MRRHVSVGLATSFALAVLSPSLYSKAKDLFTNMDAGFHSQGPEDLSNIACACVQQLPPDQL